jgi:hypothetical protein
LPDPSEKPVKANKTPPEFQLEFGAVAIWQVPEKKG